MYATTSPMPAQQLVRSPCVRLLLRWRVEQLRTHRISELDVTMSVHKPVPIDRQFGECRRCSQQVSSRGRLIDSEMFHPEKAPPSASRPIRTQRRVECSLDSQRTRSIKTSILGYLRPHNLAGDSPSVNFRLRACTDVQDRSCNRARLREYAVADEQRMTSCVSEG